MELSKSIKAGMALASISTYDELSRISGVPLNTLKKYASIKAKHSPNMQNLIKLNKVIDLSDYISSSSKDSIISKDNLNKSDNLSLNQKEIVPQLSLNDEKIVPQSKKNAILQLLNDADESKIDYLLQQLSLNQKKDVHKSMSISHDDLSISQEKDVHKSQKNTIFQSSKSEKYTKDDKNVHKSVSPVSKLSVSQGKNVSKSIDELTLHVNIVSHCASAGTSSEIHDVEVYDTDQTMPISKLLFKTPKKAENLRAIQIEGLSMMPVLYPDCWVIFELANEYNGDGIYIINFRDVLMVKMLQLTSKNTLKIISTNKDYESWDIDVDDQSVFKIFGKVVRSII